MKKTFKLLPAAASLSVLTLCISLAASAQSGPAQPSVSAPNTSSSVPNAQLAGKELNAKVEALLKRMTLEEKIGQTVQYSAGFATGPEASKLSYDQLTERGDIGSMLNVIGAEATNHYQHIAMEKSRLHIPLIFGHDVIHGEHTIFPVP